ncbi:putative nuclease HARBI1 [Teleopsis dalmanni]|uniref:putative nuclease HARBI1 n=1 Tax=Teleopsis dalmanni TaxID=139649 RepID=UPI0018CD0F6B|nr:putative nuclease HARBI1 [Teleopsis dalmanni]
MKKRGGNKINLRKVPKKKHRMADSEIYNVGIKKGTCISRKTAVSILYKAALVLLRCDSDTESESEEENDDEFLYHLSKYDELIAIICAQDEIKNHKNYIENILQTYTEEKFRYRFRLSSEVFASIVDMFGKSDTYIALRADKRLTAKTYVAVFLWFAGDDKCNFRVLANRFKLSISSISRIIDRVTFFLSSLSSKTISWPTKQKKIETSEFFSEMGFSKAIGCIDCARIAIDTPADRKHNFIDTEGQSTICVQGICDENKKFLDVFVGYPGSCRDKLVFQNSVIYKQLPTNCKNFYLLGDSAYPCLENLITPYNDNERLTRIQKKFNIKHSYARMSIDNAFGMLKQRFRQLYHCKLKGTQKLCHFIMACCVLHNIADENDLQFVYEIN